MSLTSDRLKELFSYDANTGAFHRLYAPARGTKTKPTGSVANNGYLQLKLGGKVYAQHRLAWLYVHGEWPRFNIDHINGIRSDNRICNLRDVEQSINLQNRSKPKSTSAHKLLGVSFDKRRGHYVARIRINGKNRSLGSWETEQAAHDAYLSAKRAHHPGYVADRGVELERIGA